jgi:hypothetical protein
MPSAKRDHCRIVRIDVVALRNPDGSCLDVLLHRLHRALQQQRLVRNECGLVCECPKRGLILVPLTEQNPFHEPLCARVNKPQR